MGSICSCGCHSPALVCTRCQVNTRKAGHRRPYSLQDTLTWVSGTPSCGQLYLGSSPYSSMGLSGWSTCTCTCRTCRYVGVRRWDLSVRRWDLSVQQNTTRRSLVPLGASFLVFPCYCMCIASYKLYRGATANRYSRHSARRSPPRDPREAPQRGVRGECPVAPPAPSQELEG